MNTFDYYKWHRFFKCYSNSIIFMQCYAIPSRPVFVPFSTRFKFKIMMFTIRTFLMFHVFILSTSLVVCGCNMLAQSQHTKNDSLLAKKTLTSAFSFVQDSQYIRFLLFTHYFSHFISIFNFYFSGSPTSNCFCSSFSYIVVLLLLHNHAQQ